MSEWPKVALGEVMRLDLVPHRVEPDTRYPNIGIYSFGRGTFAKPAIESATTSASTLYRITAGQVIYSRLFAFEGAYATVPAEHDGAFVSNEFPTFTVIEEKASPAFIGWLFRSAGTWQSLRQNTVGMGDRRQRIHPDSVLGLPIALPPISTQRSIANRLDSVADAIAARKNASAVVASDVDATLRAAFARIIGDAPRVAMGDIAPLVRRPVTIDPDGSYPELGVRSFGKGTFHKPALPGIEVGTKKLFTVEAGDLVFNIVFAWEGAVAVSLSGDAGRVGSHRFLTCVPDPDRATADFLRFWFLSEEGMLALSQASPGGAGRNRTLGIKALEAIKVPVPSLDAQLWFDSLQSKARAAKAAQAEATAHLDQLLPAMLNEVFG
jgi:type I restriction enzyme, S subunit